MKILLVCDIDSQLYACQYLAQQLEAQGCDVHFGIDYTAKVSEPLMKRHLERHPQTLLVDIDELPRTRPFRNSDAVGVYLAGSRLEALRAAAVTAGNARGRRPVLFCGFNGLVFEKFEEAMSWRVGYDVVCLNGPRDQRVLEAVLPPAMQPRRIALTGLNRAAGRPLGAPTEARPKQLVFAEQVIVPRTLPDRRYLLAQLARLAEASPDWDVVIKPRIRPGETTFHKVEEHVETTLARLGASVSNLRVSYEPLDELLATARYCLTVSSTSFFDAQSLGAMPLVVSDFGVRNSDGTHIFVGCGTALALHGLESLDAMPPLSVDAGWLRDLGYASEFGGARLLEALRDAQAESAAEPAAHTALSSAMPGALTPRLRATWLGDWLTSRGISPSPDRRTNVRASGAAGSQGSDRPAPLRTKETFDEARRAYKERDYARAEAMLLEMCLMKPTDAKPRRLLAECYIATGRLTEARQALLTARKIQPSNRRLQRRLRATSPNPLKRFIGRLTSEAFEI